MDKKKKRGIYKKIFFRVLLFFMVFYIAIYVSQETGYYEFEQNKRKVLTEEKIKQFDEDVKSGKEINMSDYIVEEAYDYQNSFTKIGKKTSDVIEKIFTSGVSTTVDFLNRIFEGK